MCQNTSFLLFISIIIDAKFWDRLIEIETLSIQWSIIIHHQIITTDYQKTLAYSK